MVKVIKIGRLRWLGHLFRMQELEPCKKLNLLKTEGTLRVGKRKLECLESVEGLKKAGLRNWWRKQAGPTTVNEILEEAKVHTGLQCQKKRSRFLVCVEIIYNSYDRVFSCCWVCGTVLDSMVHSKQDCLPTTPCIKYRHRHICRILHVFIQRTSPRQLVAEVMEISCVVSRKWCLASMLWCHLVHFLQLSGKYIFPNEFFGI